MQTRISTSSFWAG